MLLRHYLEQGFSKKTLAGKLGISRDTIHRWIREGELDRDVDQDAVRYGPRAPMPTKLDPYKETIKTRLGRFPELSAVCLFDEVKAAGYAGGYTQLKEYVRAVRPAPEPEAVVRFETPPGKQAQVDFARFRFPWGVRYALLVVLGYSRLLWLRFYERQDMRLLHHCHIVNIRGNSYRMRQHSELWQALHGSSEPEPHRPHPSARKRKEITTN